MSDDYQLRKDVDRFKGFLDRLEYNLQQRDILNLDIFSLFAMYYDSSEIDDKFVDLNDYISTTYLTQSSASSTYAPKEHQHDTWGSIDLDNEYVTEYYINTDLKICLLKYYHPNYSFTGTSEQTVENPLIPSDYSDFRPPVTVIGGSYNPKIGCAITSTGNLVANSTESGSKNLNLWFVWSYDTAVPVQLYPCDGGGGGSSGKGIISIVKTSTSGLVDTYTIYYTDETTDTFTITNGSDASVDIVTSFNSTTSDSKVPSEKLTKASLDGKADSSHSHTKSEITDFPTLSTVATSGSYSDLSNKPSIPSSSSDLTDGSSLVKTSNTTGLLKNDGTVDTSSYLTTGTASSTYVAKETGKGLFSGSYTDLTDKPTLFSGSYDDLSNKPSIPSDVSDLSDETNIIPTDVSDLTDTNNLYQTTLVSGTNIKTINNTSILGEGNITIQGGGGSVIGTGSFSINNQGHLIVELPSGVDNPYFIDNNGHLIYDTSNTYNGD